MAGKNFPLGNIFFLLQSESGDTVTESWRGYTGPKSDSMDHFVPGAVTGRLFEYLAGIRRRESGAGFEKEILKPLFIKELGLFEGEYISKNSRIYVKWKFDGENVVCNIETEADGVFILPDGEIRQFKKEKIYII